MKRSSLLLALLIALFLCSCEAIASERLLLTYRPTLARVNPRIGTRNFSSAPYKSVAVLDPWIAPDKFDHFLVCAMLSSGSFLSLKVADNERGVALVSSLGISIGVGISKEIYDKIHAGRPSWKDLSADVLGAILGALIASQL